VEVLVATLFASGGGAAGIIFIIYLAVIVLEIAALWQIFVKAGHPGWAAIIPFYNYYVMLKVVGRPGWWLILYLIPIVNFIIFIIVAIDLAKSFAKSTGFAVGLIFLAPIFIPILGFGSATYRGPAALAATGYPGGYPPQGYAPQGYQQPPQGYQPPPQGYQPPPPGYQPQPTQSYPQPQQPGSDIPPPPPA
jgi:hypothetical protein